MPVRIRAAVLPVNEGGRGAALTYATLGLHIVTVDPFTAVADPTRRLLLERLRVGEALSIADLSQGLPMTRQAVTKHLDVLREAGLIRVHREGRERLHDLDARPLEAVDEWLRPYAEAWDRRIDALRRHLGESMAAQESER
jgi:DNA-binding transcriptional ArsR family regulator